MLTAMKQRGLSILVLAGLLAIQSYAFQNQISKPVDDQIKILKNKLLLNDEQTKKITEILEDQREEMTMAKSQHRGDQQELDAVIKDIIRKSDKKIEELLIEEQRLVYQEMIQARKEQAVKIQKTPATKKKTSSKSIKH